MNEKEIENLENVIKDLDIRIDNLNKTIDEIHHRLVQYGYLTLSEQKTLDEANKDVIILTSNKRCTEETLMMLKGGVL